MVYFCIASKSYKNLQNFRKGSLRCHQKTFIIIGTEEIAPTITVKVCEDQMIWK